MPQETNGRLSETMRVKFDSARTQIFGLTETLTSETASFQRRLSDRAASNERLHILSDQHRVAIAVEAISLFDRFSVRFHRQIVTGQSRHQNQ